MDLFVSLRVPRCTCARALLHLCVPLYGPRVPVPHADVPPLLRLACTVPSRTSYGNPLRTSYGNPLRTSAHLQRHIMDLFVPLTAPL